LEFLLSSGESRFHDLALKRRDLTSAFLSLPSFFLLLCLLFSIQDFDATVSSDIGQPVVQILIDIFGKSGAKAMSESIMLSHFASSSLDPGADHLSSFSSSVALLIVTVWHCGLFSLTSNSRSEFWTLVDQLGPLRFSLPKLNTDASALSQ